MVVSRTLPTGLRVVTESMPHVRSVSVGVWLERGSRHESEADSGIAHFVEQMLFKGTTSRSARQIAQEIDSIGGQLDAFTSKEYAGYYIKVLDEHLPIALDLLSDMLQRPSFLPVDIEKEQSVILEEIKMVEDAPDDLVHEELARHAWQTHPLGRPILGSPDTVSSFTQGRLRDYFGRTYVAPNLLVSAAGNLEHDRLTEQLAAAFAGLAAGPAKAPVAPPSPGSGVTYRQKDIEQSHVCVATPSYHQTHEHRHALHVLNTILGGSMSSRLFQHIREDRGLAYAVFSNLAAYTDTGMLMIYAGCANERVSEVVDLSLKELRELRDAPVPAVELRRAKDHLKGSLMLNLESTSSRMSHLARQFMAFGRYFTLDEMLAAIERVTVEDIQLVANDVFSGTGLVASVVGPGEASPLEAAALRV